MLSVLKKLVSPPIYQPLNKITINKSQLEQNFITLISYRKDINAAPVLKSNAYGHGLALVAKILDTKNAPFFCVDSLPEANILKKVRIKTPILVMGAIAEQSLKAKKLPYFLTIINNQALEYFLRYQPKANVHLFVDTGMNREGIKLEELSQILTKIKNSSLNLVGVMTHLAIASDPNDPLTKKQLENFKKAKKQILNAGFNPTWFHIGGSDALSWIQTSSNSQRHSLVKGNLFNLVRLGRLLYGIGSTEMMSKDLGVMSQKQKSKNTNHSSPITHYKIHPVLQLESTIVQIKQVKKGESIGYNATYKAQKDITIALLPIGYNDGVDKRLSNKGTVTINSTQAKILGLINMNMIVVDISSLNKISVGDKAMIFSPNPDESNSIEQSAKKINTNPSDLLVGLHASTRREISPLSLP